LCGYWEVVLLVMYSESGSDYPGYASEQ
jgi:hypothetical protein